MFSRNGGGINCYRANLNMINCVVSYNTANNELGGNGDGNGGGIYFDTNSSQAVNIFNCLIEHNDSDRKGGGIYMSNSSRSNIFNCEIKNNSAAVSVGGVFFNGKSTVQDTTICGNSPDQYEGIYVDNGGNTIEDECSTCPGDATGDGYVDVNDVLHVIANWDTPDPNADFDEDGLVDADDVLILLSHFGEACP